MRRIKFGIVLNYTVMFVNILSGFLLTPYMISTLGETEYSIYQLIVSLSGYLTVVNLGTGAAMNRFVSIFKTKNDKNAENNYISLNLFVTFILMVLVVLIGFFLKSNLINIFPNILSSSYNEYLAETMCLIVIINVSLNFLSSSLEGLLQAYGRIDLTKGFALFKIVSRFIMIWILLRLGAGSIVITLVDSVLVVTYLIYIYLCLKKAVRFRFYIMCFKIDKELLIQTIMFSLANLLSGLSGQLNNNIDKTILGILASQFEITVYTVATTFYTMFTSLGVSLNGIYLNKVTEMIHSGATNTEIEDLNIKIGRFQNFVIGLLFFGFVVLGRDFIIAWMGTKYEIIYWYSLVLIIPNYFVCIGGVQESILDAMNKKMIKSCLVFIIGILNFFITIILVSYIGGFGAPLATMFSLVLGYNIMLNIYFQKYLNINILRIYKNVMKDYIVVQLLTISISYIIFKFIKQLIFNYWIIFIIEGFIFTSIYCVISWLLIFRKKTNKIIFIR